MSTILSITAARKLYAVAVNSSINGAFTAAAVQKRGAAVARRVRRDTVEKPVLGDLDSFQLAARAGIPGDEPEAVAPEAE